MQARTAQDLIGLEYDWVACDEVGCVALFSTAGRSFAPPSLVQDVDAHDTAIRRILAMPRFTEATAAPVVGAGCENTWRLFAERGFFAFDGDFNGGNYRRVAIPAKRRIVHELPPTVIAIVEETRLRDVRFGDTCSLTDEQLAALCM